MEASVRIGEPHCPDETFTGALAWLDRDGRTLPLPEVDPVAWSEGIRMAVALYEGGTTEEDENA
ncbi:MULTISPECIES: hypothetical protein [unclassified Streptomyces]|uniref:hypothetical protein n=1 Tax=unclassified Streptomyces TaxID=2593676 RepID=UPI0033BD472B